MADIKITDSVNEAIESLVKILQDLDVASNLYNTTMNSVSPGTEGSTGIYLGKASNNLTAMSQSGSEQLEKLKLYYSIAKKYIDSIMLNFIAEDEKLAEMVAKKIQSGEYNWGQYDFEDENEE